MTTPHVHSTNYNDHGLFAAVRVDDAVPPGMVVYADPSVPDSKITIALNQLDDDGTRYGAAYHPEVGELRYSESDMKKADTEKRQFALLQDAIKRNVRKRRVEVATPQALAL